jgi:hypothetical protein
MKQSNGQMKQNDGAHLTKEWGKLNIVKRQAKLIRVGMKV